MKGKGKVAKYERRDSAEMGNSQAGILCIKYLRRSVITQNEEKKKKKRHRQNRGLYS